MTMTGNIDFDKTRKLFSKLIDRPPLTDQLLQRPPFRFILDIVHATKQNTGYLDVCNCFRFFNLFAFIHYI